MKRIHIFPTLLLFLSSCYLPPSIPPEEQPFYEESLRKDLILIERENPTLRKWEENEEEFTRFQEYLEVSCESPHREVRDAAIFLKEYDSPEVDSKLQELESCRIFVQSLERKALRAELFVRQQQWCFNLGYPCKIKDDFVFVSIEGLYSSMEGIDELIDTFCITQTNGLFNGFILVTDTGNKMCFSPVRPSEVIQKHLVSNGYYTKWESSREKQAPVSLPKPDPIERSNRKPLTPVPL